jgi:hypothetical protein
MSKLKLIFGPGCFNDFEGTQEELDELVAELHKLTESGDILKNARQIDIFDDEYDMEVIIDNFNKKRLH